MENAYEQMLATNSACVLMLIIAAAVFMLLVLAEVAQSVYWWNEERKYAKRAKAQRFKGLKELAAIGRASNAKIR